MIVILLRTIFATHTVRIKLTNNHNQNNKVHTIQGCFFQKPDQSGNNYPQEEMERTESMNYAAIKSSNLNSNNSLGN